MFRDDRTYSSGKISYQATGITRCWWWPACMAQFNRLKINFAHIEIEECRTTTMITMWFSMGQVRVPSPQARINLHFHRFRSPNHFHHGQHHSEYHRLSNELRRSEQSFGRCTRNAYVLYHLSLTCQSGEKISLHLDRLKFWSNRAVSTISFQIEDGLTEDEQSLVVLDPSHPLMIRYQQALRRHLTQREEKLNLQLREADNELKVPSKASQSTSLFSLSL